MTLLYLDIQKAIHGQDFFLISMTNSPIAKARTNDSCGELQGIWLAMSRCSMTQPAVDKYLHSDDLAPRNGLDVGAVNYKHSHEY